MSNDKDIYDISVKIVVIGEPGVGKTNLLSRYMSDTFNIASKSTIGLDFAIKKININDKRLRLVIFDTAGQERYRAITKGYYRGAAGALLVYDITKHDTFEDIPRWLGELRIQRNDDAVVMLVGNKSDLEDERAVTQEEAKEYAKEHGLMFLETSALTSDNVDVMFHKIAQEAVTKLSDNLQAQRDKQARTLHGQAIDLADANDSTSALSSNCSC